MSLLSSLTNETRRCGAEQEKTCASSHHGFAERGLTQKKSFAFSQSRARLENIEKLVQREAHGTAGEFG